MGRLIDADEFEVVSLKGVSDDFAEGARFVLELIDKAPTVDAEIVVRCGECKNYKPMNHCRERSCCTKARGIPLSKPDDFCSYGERRSDDR